jgi:pimeloyl-ACP methyl ester carboxylesterase
VSGVAPEVEVLLSRAADGVAVAVVTPPGHERTAAMFLGYAAGLDDFELQRFRLLASLTATRLVVVETPGHGTHASRLLAAERRALRRSDLGPLAARLDATATEAVGAQPATVVGYSMGASTAAAAARERSVHGAAPAAVILVEPVAVRRWGLVELARAMRSERKVVGTYLRETALVAGSVPLLDRLPGAPRSQRHWPDMALTSNALRAGRINDDLLSSVGTGTLVVVAHGDLSRVSNGPACATLARAVDARGGRGVDLTLRGSHGLWHSLPRVRELAGALREVAGWA